LEGKVGGGEVRKQREIKYGMGGMERKEGDSNRGSIHQT
jgi:hypothetical protein